MHLWDVQNVHHLYYPWKSGSWSQSTKSPQLLFQVQMLLSLMGLFSGVSLDGIYRRGRTVRLVKIPFYKHQKIHTNVRLAIKIRTSNPRITELIWLEKNL